MSEEEEKEFIFYSVEKAETLKRFHCNNSIFRGIRGVIGSGKSSACAWEVLSRCKEQRVFRGKRKSRWAIIRSTTPDLKQTTLNTFLDWVPEREMPGYYHRVVRQPPMHSTLIMTLEDKTIVEAEFYFIACDLEDDIRKLKSLELTGAWINEASEIRKSIVNMAIGRCFRYPAKRNGGSLWCGVISDTNPPDDQSWWYKAAEVEQPEGWVFFDQPPALIPIPKENDDDPQLYMPNRGQDPRYGPAENVENIEIGFKYYLQLAAGMSEDEIKVYLLGEYGTIVSGKPVYSSYIDKIHYSQKELKIYRGLPLIIGQDFGIPPTAVLGQLTPQGQLRILDELIPQDTEGKLIDMGMKQFVRDVLKPHLALHYAGMRLVILCDPTSANMRSQSDIGALTSIKEMIYAGLDAEYALTNDFKTRRDAVEGFMLKLIAGEPGLIISPKCPETRRGFRGKYHFRKMRMGGGEQYAERPEKNHPWSDVHDCMIGETLVFMGDGTEKPMADIRTGDYVMTPEGSRKVTNAWKVSDSSEVMEVVLSNGKTLIGTPDHRIMTSNGWKKIDCLQYNDILEGISIGDVSCKKIGLIEFVSSAVQRLLFQFGKLCKAKMCIVPLFAAIRVGEKQTDLRSMAYGLRERTEGHIIGIKQIMEPAFLCTSMSGKRLMGQPQMASVCITRTEIKTIMRLAILNAFRFLTMPHFMQTSIIRKIQKLWGAASRLPRRRLKNGINLLLGLSGIAFIQRKYGSNERKMRLSVRNVGKDMKPTGSMQNEVSVLQPASLRHDETAELMTRQEFARPVKPNSSSTNMPKLRHAGIRVVCVNGVPRRKAVYDLTVEEEHCFYANRVLVHNCIQYIAMYADGGKTFGSGQAHQSTTKRKVKKRSAKSFG